MININTYVQLITTHLQFMALLSYLDVDWPDLWKDVLNYVSLLNLDPQDLIGDRELPVIDFRMLFILICIVIPLIINLLILLLFQPLSRIIWYFVLVTGAVLLAIGMLGKYLPSSGLKNAEEASNFYIYLGAGMVGLMLLLLVILKIYTCCYPESSDQRIDRLKEEREYLEHFHRQRVFVMFGISSLLILGGLLLSGLLRNSVKVVEDAGSSVGGLVLVIAWGALIVGGFVFFYMLLHLCACGRRVLTALRKFIKTNLLMFLLIIISCTYVPILTYCLNTFMCSTFSCPAGFAFNPYATRSSSMYNRSEEVYCDPCNFLNPSCGAGNATSLCPGYEKSRNLRSPDIPCDDEAMAYFSIAAAIVLLAYVAGIPTMYFFIIRYLSNQIKTRIVADPELWQEIIVTTDEKIKRELKEEHWLMQTEKCSCAAGSLYEPFRIHLRYYMLLALGHRLAVVTILVVISPFSPAATVGVLIVHAIMCLVFFVVHPYAITCEHVLAAALAVCNVLNAIYAVVVWRKGGDVPDYITGFFILFNVIIPFIAAIALGLFRACAKPKKKDQEEEKKEDHATEPYAEDRATEPYAEGTTAVAVAPAGSSRARAQTSVSSRRDGEDSLNSTTRRKRSQSQLKESKKEKRQREERESRMLEETMSSLRGSQVHQKSLAVMEGQPVVTDEEIEMVKEDLNEETANKLSAFFMVMGLALMVALGFALLGTLRQKGQTDNPIATYSSNRGVDNVLGDYPSWEDMTGSCCCLQSRNPSPRFSVTERWVCPNNRTIDKGRVSEDGEDNSLSLRELCSPTFREELPSCRVKIFTDPDETDEDGVPIPQTEMFCSSIDKKKIVPGDVSEWAFDYYW